MRGRGVYRGRGRGRGYTRGGGGGSGRSSYHTTGYNKHINKKWVRESPNDDDYNGLKEGSTSSTGYPIKSNASISTNSITEVNKSTASTYKWKRQSPDLSTNSLRDNITGAYSMGIKVAINGRCPPGTLEDTLSVPRGHFGS